VQDCASYIKGNACGDILCAQFEHSMDLHMAFL